MDNPHRSSSTGNNPARITQRRQDLGTEHERGISTIDGTNQNQHKKPNIGIKKCDKYIC